MLVRFGGDLHPTLAGALANDGVSASVPSELASLPLLTLLLLLVQPSLRQPC